MKTEITTTRLNKPKSIKPTNPMKLLEPDYLTCGDGFGCTEFDKTVEGDCFQLDSRCACLYYKNSTPCRLNSILYSKCIFILTFITLTFQNRKYLSRNCIGFECKYHSYHSTEIAIKVQDQQHTMLNTTQEIHVIYIGTWIIIGIFIGIVAIVGSIVLYYRNYIYCTIDCPKNTYVVENENYNPEQTVPMAIYRHNKDNDSIENETVEIML